MGMGNWIYKGLRISLIFFILNPYFQIMNPLRYDVQGSNIVPKFQLDQLTPRNKIKIQDNSNFVGFPGAGTEEDPYVISGFEITAPESGNYILIDIQDTDVHFIIENNYLSGNGNDNGEGILFSGVKNAIVRNNEIHDTSSDGIRIDYSQDVLVENNLIYNGWYHGIGISDTNDIVIRHNDIQNNLGDGIASYFSKDNSFMDNILSFNGYNGIRLEISDSHILSGNSIDSNGEGGIYLGSASTHQIEFNTISNNPNGISIIIQTEVNTPSDYNIIVGNILDSNDQGILINYGEENSFFNNLIDESRLNGILMFNGLRNEFHHNIVSNTNGFQGFASTDSSSENIIECNLFSENKIFGVFIDTDSENELIKNNDFVNNINNPQAHDSGVSNIFQNNYWSDQEVLDQNNNGINDNEYTIDGLSANKDTNPVITGNFNNSDPNICVNEDISLYSDFTDPIIFTATNSSTPIKLEPSLEFPIEIFIVILSAVLMVGVIIFFKHKSNSN